MSSIKMAPKPPKGIPQARIAVSPGRLDNGMPQVTAFLSALDVYSFPRVVASLRLSPAEARDLAARLVRAANESEIL